jgi:hypothetical protein
MQYFRNAALIAALVGASFLASVASAAEGGKGDKVAVDTLPAEVKATFAKEAPDAKEVYKSSKDGKDTYRAKVTGADGKTVILTVGADGAVISKKEPHGKGDAPAK